MINYNNESFYFSHIITSNETLYINKLLILLQKFIYIYDLSFFNNLNNKSDYDIILYLKNNHKIKDNLSYDNNLEKQNKKINNITNVINNYNNKINTYLDIGCYNGSKTIKIGQNLNLSKNNIYGIDVDNYAGMKIKPINNNFQFINYTKQFFIPLNNNFIDLITLLQVLHHIKHPNRILNEIIRISKNGTLLYIIDHDCYNKYIECLIRLEHLLYGILIDKTDYKIYKENMYERYFSKKNLIKKFKKYGFKIIMNNNINYGPTNYYNILFQLLK